MDKLLDLKESKLLLEGTPDEQKTWKKKISDYVQDLLPDKNERKNINTERHDFYTGNQGDYSNIIGIIKDTKQKKGHTNQVTNYAGKTVVKMAFGIANNPPKISVVPTDVPDKIEEARAQAVEDYQDEIFGSKRNRFFKKTYRNAAFQQGEYGDVAIKTYLNNKQICIKLHQDISTLMVGWNGDPGEFDFVIAENYYTPQKVYDEFGIKVNEKALGVIEKQEPTRGVDSWSQNNQWNTRSGGSKTQSNNLPTGRNLLPKVKVLEYDSEEAYAIQIESELVSLVFKDDITYPKVKFWTIVPNIPNPPSPWSISDIDYLKDVQIELNENDNRTSDHLRVGNVQRYVAYNMNDFDPESIKTSSGQVIFVNDPEGKSRFEPLPTNINNFPDEQYHSRKLNQMYDMGLPKVNYGVLGASSGRSKAIDYQSSIDLTQYKRDSWELGLSDICEKIQIFGNFLLGKDYDWFQNSQGEFIVRDIEFDWTDILPVSQSDKIVNIANKFNMIGIPLRQAFKELGYRNAEAMISELKEELKDPDLMVLRSKAWNLSQGLLQANNSAATMAQGMNGGVNQPSPTLTPEQNTGTKPMAAKGGTTTYSSAMGAIDKTRQNMQAQGG